MLQPPPRIPTTSVFNQPAFGSMQSNQMMQRPMHPGSPQQYMGGPPTFGGQQPFGGGGQRIIIDEKSSSTSSEEFIPYGRQEYAREPMLRESFGPSRQRASYTPLSVSREGAFSPPPVRIVGRPMSPPPMGIVGRAISPPLRRSEEIVTTSTYYPSIARQPAAYTSGLYQSGYLEDYSRRSVAPPVILRSIVHPPTQVAVLRSEIAQVNQAPPPPARPPWAGRNLLIRPIGARLTHNTHFFLKKMNPFIEVLVGPARFKTAVNRGGGKRPQWNESFTHQILGNEPEMTIIVWDQHRRRVQLIGETRINLNEVYAHGRSSNWYELFWKGKPAGRVLINLEII